MKLIDIVNSRDALQKLVAQDLPLRIAYRLVKLTDSINVQMTFYFGELTKLGDNPDPERIRELDEMEITDLKVDRLRIPITDDLKLSATDVHMLEPFITFYEEGEE